MINPFISVDEQLKKYNWNKFYENNNGFRFVKKIGVDVFLYADFDKYGIKFYHEVPELFAIEVSEITLELFAAKIKEWRKKYECSDKTRSNGRQTRS